MKTENNKLIAEFMGLKKYGYKNENYLLLNKHLSPEQLPYSTSWDWLMPVIIKIADIRKDTHYKLYKTIDKAHQEVVEFIKDNKTTN
jgi:hypothetical protein